ncbi:MAG: glycosyltransferase [Vicinamibacteria bacterium]|nr:glycosyltransferase [Vicinamibacteria bacterium]
MTHKLRLSVVIGVHNAETVIAECLAALERQDGRAHAEIIVADSSTDGTPEIVRRQFPDVRLLHSDAPLALPQLRGRGIAAAQGEIIAVIDAYSIVDEGWILETLKAHDTHPHVVIGGSVDLHEACRRSVAAWAIYINEYGMFMPPVPHGETWILPGSNIAYKRRALFDAQDQPRFGDFWKTFANWDLESAGQPLLLVPGMGVRLRKPISFLDFLRTRVDHGRCFGGMRVASRPLGERVVRAASCLLVPFVLQYRWSRAYLPKRRRLGVFLLTLPLQLLLFGTWAIGECVGYLRGPGPACRRLFY